MAPNSLYGTPILPPWRHVKTLYMKIYAETETNKLIASLFRRWKTAQTHIICSMYQSLCVVLILCQLRSHSLMLLSYFVFFFSSPDVEWKKQRFLLHAIYLSVISLLVALNIFLVVRRWRKPHIKGNWNNYFSAK